MSAGYASDPRLQEAAAFLATLPEEDRDKGLEIVRARTLAAAPAGEVGKPPVRNIDEYLDWEVPMPPMLVEPGLVARGAITLLVSRGGKGKTAVTLNMLTRWAAGLPMFDDLPEVLSPDEPLKSLIIENEGAPGMFQQHIRRIVAPYTGDERQLIGENLLIWGDGGWSDMKLDEDKSINLVRRALELHKPDIVFLEPFKGLWSGDENSNVDMNNVLDRLTGLATQNNCGIILTHHERKSGAGEDGEELSAVRGASSLEGHAAVIFRWKPVQNNALRELRQIKFRFGQPIAPVRMQFDVERHGYGYVSENEKLRTIIGHMEGAPSEWYGVAELAEELGETERVIRDTLNAHTKPGAKSKQEERFRRTKITGQSGWRYRLVGGSEDDEGGLGLT